MSAKDELAKIRLKNNEKTALLLGTTRAEGTLVIRYKSGMGVKFSLESMAVVKLISKLASELYSTESEVSVHETNTGVGAKNVVLCLFGAGVEKLISDCGMLDDTNALTFTQESERRAYVRGVFLSRGSVNDPNNSYHLEIVCNSETLASIVTSYCETFGVTMKLTNRGGDYILYIKDSAVISDFLKLIGAVESTLELENVKTERDMNNYVNRATNCDMSNLRKTVEASSTQIRAISSLIEAGVALPTYLRDTATARLSYPEASLAVLADTLGVSKSCLSHRLTKLVRLAESLSIHSDEE